MKKQPGKIRYVKFEGDCYINADDISGFLNEIPNNHIKRFLTLQIEAIIFSCSNLVIGMLDKDKKQWNDIMKPN